MHILISLGSHQLHLVLLFWILVSFGDRELVFCGSKEVFVYGGWRGLGGEIGREEEKLRVSSWSSIFFYHLLGHVVQKVVLRWICKWFCFLRWFTGRCSSRSKPHTEHWANDKSSLPTFTGFMTLPILAGLMLSSDLCDVLCFLFFFFTFCFNFIEIWSINL
jgi:hypothetical protein